MPQQPPPQSPQPDGPTSSPAAATNGARPQSGVPPHAARHATPPDGYAWSNGHGAAPGRASASGAFGAVGQQGRPLLGPPPGYGPAGPPPVYRPAPPTRAYAAPSADATTAVAAPEEPKKRDLTINKLVAGAGAASASAVLGSFFGAMGTVGGAAVGSIFSALITSLMQHSLDKTRDTVKAKVKLPGGATVKVSGTTEVPAPRGTSGQASTRVFVTPGDAPTEVISAVPAVDAGPPKSRRRLLVMTGFAVVVFAIGMLAITGIELVKGSPLNTSSSSSTSERPGGTSLGTVLGNSGNASTETTEAPAPSETEEPSSDASEEPSDDEGADTTAEPRTGFGAEDEDATSEGDTTPTPTTTTPRSGGQGDEGGQSGGGAVQQQGGGAEADEQQ